MPSWKNSHCVSIFVVIILIEWYNLTIFDLVLLVAKKRSLFDDRPQEIQELTYIVREDITNLNKQIAHLQGFMKKQQPQQQQNTKAHSANVVVALQSKLANMSTEFKQVLEVRTEVQYINNIFNFWNLLLMFTKFVFLEP